MTETGSGAQRAPIPVAISARHVHLSSQTADILFGAQHSLKVERALSQPGQYVAQETVSLRGPKGTIHGVKVLGPLRGQDQIEISRSDAFSLGLDPPIRLSGDVADSAPITLIGPNGSVQLASGA